MYYRVYDFLVVIGFIVDVIFLYGDGEISRVVFAVFLGVGGGVRGFFVIFF